MKKFVSLFLGLFLLVSSVTASATSYALLQLPVRPATWLLKPATTPLYYGDDVGYTTCSATAFNSASTGIVGYCSFYHKNVGSYIIETHNATWDLKGVVTLGTQCAHTDPTSLTTGSWKLVPTCVTRTATVISGTAVYVPGLQATLYFNTANSTGTMQLLFNYPYDYLYIL